MLCKCSGKYIDIYFNLKITFFLFKAFLIAYISSVKIDASLGSLPLYVFSLNVATNSEC